MLPWEDYDHYCIIYETINNQALAAKDTGAAIQTLGTIAKQHGMSDLARTCGVARESLYRSLSSDGNPELVTFLSVLQAMGLKMTIGKVR